MELYKGIFWYINNHLLCRKVRCDSAGNPLESVDFTSKSGDNFNHKAEWKNMSKKSPAGNRTIIIRAAGLKSNAIRRLFNDWYTDMSIF